MTLDEFLSRLHNVHGHSAQCPAHDDHANSLSVSTGKDGRIVVKCHAGCRAEDICAALGLKLSDLFAEPLPYSAAPPAKRTLSARYDYYDLNGAFLYRKTRWVDENGKKSFTWSRRDSADKWQSAGRRSQADEVRRRAGNQRRAAQHGRLGAREKSYKIRLLRCPKRIHSQRGYDRSIAFGM